MKKAYEAPVAERVTFEYKDQVVAASSSTWVNVGSPTVGYCQTDPQPGQTGGRG